MLPSASQIHHPSTVAGRWNLLRQIGAGSGGTTWYAVDERGAEAVVKWLNEPPGDELRALASLVHPSIPAYLGAGSQPMAYVVMERATGRSGADVLRLGGADSLIVARTLSWVASGLHLAHSRGVVHGDVAPSNIIIGDDRVWLVDFGLAGSEEGGTPGFAAPERFEGAGEAASDVYSLGLVCWALLHGEAPPPPGVRAAAAPAPALHGPRWLGDLIESMTQPDPALRPTALEVARECEARGIEPPPIDLKKLARRARSLFVERTVHRRLRRWFAHRDLLSVVGQRGSGIRHTARWAVEELLASGALVIEVDAGGGPLEPLVRLAEHPALSGRSFELDPNSPKGLVFDTVDRILDRVEGSMTLVVRGEGMSETATEVFRLLAASPRVSMLWVDRQSPSWISERLALAPWTPDDLGDLATQLLGVEHAPGWVERLVPACKGVPGILVDALLRGIQAGAVARDGGGWSADAAALGEVFDAATLERPAFISPLAHHLGAAAAAWGHSLPIEVALRWIGAMALPVPEWKEAVQELVVEGLVRADGSQLQVLGPSASAFLLDHAQAPVLRLLAFAEADRDQVPAEQWLRLAISANVTAALAKRGAAAIDTVAATQPGLSARLAHQAWLACAPADRTVDLSVAVVKAFAAAGNHERAEELLHDLSEEAEPAARASLVHACFASRDPATAARLLALGGDHPALSVAEAHATAVGGDLAGGLQCLESIPSEGLSEGVRRQWVLSRARLIRLLGDPDRALEVLEAFAEGDGAWHDEMGCAFLAAGMARDAAPHFERASRMMGWSVIDRANLTNQAGVAWHRAGDMLPAMTALEEAGPLFQRLGLEGPAGRCYANIAECARVLGRYGVARHRGERALALCGRVEDHIAVRMVLSNLLALDLDEGALSQAEAHLRAALRLETEVELPWDAELACRALRYRFVMGESDLLDEVMATRSRAELNDEHRVVADLLLLECRLLVRTGKASARNVRERLDRAAARLVGHGNGGDLAETRVGFAEVLLSVEDHQGAERLATQARAWAEEFQRRPLRAQADRVLTRVQDGAPQAEDASKRVARLVQLSIEILGEREPKRVLDAIAEAARDLTGADRAFLIRVQDDERVPPSQLHDRPTDERDPTTDHSLDCDDPSSSPVIVASAGAAAQDSPSWTVLRRCMRAERAVIVSDLAERDDLNRARSVRKMRLHAALAVPFDRHGELYGVIYVDKVGGSFEQLRASVGVLRFLASYAGVALTNALDMEQLRGRAEHAEEVMHDIGNLLMPFADAAASQPVPGETLQAAASAVVDVAGHFSEGSRTADGPGSVCLPDVLDSWLRAYAHLGATRQVNVDLEVEDHPAAELTVRAGSSELQRVVGNLVSNGMKYARRGGTVLVRLGCRSVGAPDRHGEDLLVVIDVIDDGPGVPKGSEERIFQREVQAVGARRGLGLGLSIARRITRELGGDVRLVPRSEGAHFRVQLPGGSNDGRR